MRCLNCGWDNAPSVLRCIKCNIPLKGTMGAGSGQAPPPPPAPTGDDPVSGTIPATKVDLPAWDEGVAPAPTPQQQSSCPHCKYPLASNSSTCPNCHKPLTEAVPPKAQAQAPTVKSDGPVGGTIDPYRQVKGDSFSLTPIPRGSEQAMPDLQFMGQDVELNRAKLEPTNNSITSKVQAVVKQIDGEWHIVDQSEMQTTFVRPSVPVKLQPGDIILLGDRKFTFNG